MERRQEGFHYKMTRIYRFGSLLDYAILLTPIPGLSTPWTSVRSYRGADYQAEDRHPRIRRVLRC